MDGWILRWSSGPGQRRNLVGWVTIAKSPASQGEAASTATNNQYILWFFSTISCCHHYWRKPIATHDLATLVQFYSLKKIVWIFGWVAFQEGETAATSCSSITQNSNILTNYICNMQPFLLNSVKRKPQLSLNLVPRHLRELCLLFLNTFVTFAGCCICCTLFPTPRIMLNLHSKWTDHVTSYVMIGKA